MSAPRQRVSRAFRRGMPSYDRAARAQARIAARLAALMAEAGIGAPDRALEFGCGTGFLTRHILDRFSPHQLVLNDLLPECRDHVAPMAEAAGATWTFAAGAVEELALEGRFDLIASASTVQWLDDLPRQIDGLCARLAPGGWLALSGFGPAHFDELQRLGSAAQAPGYAGAADWAALLPAGMTPVVLHEARMRLAFADGAALLRHLRDTGVNARAGQRWTKRDLTRFDDRYRASFSRCGALVLSYQPTYILARKSG